MLSQNCSYHIYCTSFHIFFPPQTLDHAHIYHQLIAYATQMLSHSLHFMIMHQDHVPPSLQCSSLHFILWITPSSWVSNYLHITAPLCVWYTFLCCKAHPLSTLHCTAWLPVIIYHCILLFPYHLQFAHLYICCAFNRHPTSGFTVHPVWLLLDRQKAFYAINNLRCSENNTALLKIAVN